jgi:nitroreductase
MDLFEAIRTRKSVRKFNGIVPPMEDIEKIIDAARLAPSSTNSQMWKYIVIFDEKTKTDLKQAVSDKYDEILGWKEAENLKEKIDFYKQYSIFFANAPVVIAVVQEPRNSIMEDIFREKGYSEEEILRYRPNPPLLSIGASIENLSLAAHALGYGTCWLTAPICAHKKMEEILEIKEPDRLVSILCLGIPADSDQKPTPKKDLSEIMTVIESAEK